MKYELDNNIISKLNENEIVFLKANIDHIDNILEVFSERMKWFKENNIKQWSRYLENHPKEEFEDVIINGNYFILIKDNKIIAGFEISEDSKYWNDNISQAYYIYKIVTKVGSKEIGNLIFEISRNIAKLNNKKYLRLDCLTNNEKLNHIYESYGFKLIKTGCLKNYHYNLRELKINE